MRVKQNFLFDLGKLIEYSASVFNVVLSNPYVGPLPRIKITFFSLSICTDDLISTPKIMAFAQPKFGSEKNERISNPLPEPLYTHLSGSALLANVTLLNKQSFKVKLEFESCDKVF